ncbi:MAG: hypothetical protein E7503_08705 [Ruminococcus sp.]|nr:hypothetical protein [Ruminococcus sp.]
MKQAKNSKKNLLCKIIVILVGIILTGTFCYGILLLGLGLYEHHTLQNAKTHYTAVPVCVTEITQMRPDDPWYIVALEPPDAKARDRLGVTYTNVFRSKLQTGDLLTLYYDPDAPQTRIVDLKTTGSQLLRGTLCTLIPAAAGIMLLLYRRRRNKRKPPAVTICPQQP